jgi:hypothetical protein
MKWATGGEQVLKIPDNRRKKRINKAMSGCNHQRQHAQSPLQYPLSADADALHKKRPAANMWQWIGVFYLTL